MPNFAFQARDRGGKTISGTREAADQRAALESLREAGLFVTDLTPTRNSPRANVSEAVAGATQSTLSPVANTPVPPVQPEAAPTRNYPNPNQNATFDAAMAPPQTDWWARANKKQLSLYFRQMHGMIHAGTSLAQALAVLGQHESNRALRRASQEMHLRTSRGMPWSETMKAYPGIFSELMIGMIAAGEAGGFLDRVCLRLSEWAERDYQIEQTIKRETWYPKLLVFCSFLIPSVVPLFLQGFGAWLSFVIPPLLLVSGVWVTAKTIGYFLPLSSHMRPLRKVIDTVKLLTPIAGKTARALAISKFCRALGATYAAGMAPHRAVNIAANACGNVAIGDRVKEIIPRLEQGEGMTNSLSSTGHFQPVVLQMLRTGEESGKIDEQLDNVANFLEADAETTIKQSVKALGILVFLLVALYIGSQIVGSYGGYVGGVASGMEM
jgi:type IV pilus assembly protein PilC